jgi:hypothetical protein
VTCNLGPLYIITAHVRLLPVWCPMRWTASRDWDIFAWTTLYQHSLDHPVRRNLELENGHEFTAWRLKHLPPRVHINEDKHTIELYVVINQFGRFLLTNWSTNVPGRSYVAICKGCTFIYTRTSCSMDWKFPGGPILENAWHKPLFETPCICNHYEKQQQFLKFQCKFSAKDS